MSMRIDPQATLRFSHVRQADNARDQAHKSGVESGREAARDSGSQPPATAAPAEQGPDPVRTSTAGALPTMVPAAGGGQEQNRPAGGPSDLEAALRSLEAQGVDLQAVARRLQEAQRDTGWVPADTNKERPGVADPDEARQSAETLRRTIEAQAQVAARIQVRGLAGAAVNLLA